MTHKALTVKIVESLEPEQLLYAEIAEGGAMGDSGGATLYTMDGQSYYCNYRENADAHSALWDFLFDDNAREKLHYCYGGFGNHAFKNPSVSFERDDANDGFIYKGISISASCLGVYQHVVLEFTEGAITDEIVAKWVKYLDRLNADERAFLNCFIENRHKESVETSLDDYLNAISYIKYINLMDSHYDASRWLEAWRTSMAKYRLRYVYENCDRKTLVDALRGFNFQKAKKGDFAKVVLAATGIDIVKLFAEYTVEKRDGIALFAVQEIRYPVVVEFSHKTHEKIVEQILTLEPDFVRHMHSLGQYFATCILNLDKVPLSIVLPAAFHVVRIMPIINNMDQEQKDLFWVASEIINTAWKYIDDSEEFERKVYEAYWTKIDGLWPIKNYGKWRYCDSYDGEKNEVADYIFDEALGFITSLENIGKFNPELEGYLHSCDDTNCAMVRNRHLLYSCEGMSDEEVLSKYYKQMTPRFIAFYYPNSIERAELLFDKMLRSRKYPELSRGGFWLSLYSTLHKNEVGKRLVELATDNFEKIHKKLGDAGMIELFYAACEGAKADMITSLEPLMKKVVKVAGADTKIIHSALDYAKQNVKITEFQRESLKNISTRRVAKVDKNENVDPELAPEDGDDLYRAAAKIAIKEKRISTALLQRRLRIGYGRAFAILDCLEDIGAVGATGQNNKPREVIIKTIEEFDEKFQKKVADYKR